MKKTTLITLLGASLVLTGCTKCADQELFNPYTDTCVSKQVLCQPNAGCALLESQNAIIENRSLSFTLISASEGEIKPGFDSAKITLNTSTEIINLNNFDKPSAEIDDCTVYLESADGDKDVLMGAEFKIICQ